MHTAYLVSVFQAVSKPQFLRTFVYSLIHSLCGPAHGIQTKDTDSLYTIRCVCTANEEVRLWSYSTSTCVGLRNTKFVVMYHTTFVSPPSNFINTKKKTLQRSFLKDPKYRGTISLRDTPSRTLPPHADFDS
jgi:hypothetical protein